MTRPRILSSKMMFLCLLCAWTSVLSQELRSVQLAQKDQNLKMCLSGRYPNLCKHELLTIEEGLQVVTAERRENLKTCLSGRYVALCKHGILSPDEKIQVADAESVENLKICLSGKYPNLCKHELLKAGEMLQVETAERRENLKICLSGRYAALCKHSLLSSDEKLQVADAERAENLKICLSGRYPGLCNKELLKSTSNSGEELLAAIPSEAVSPNLLHLQSKSTMVYVLHVYDNEGVYTSTSNTERRAFQDLVAYVKKRWVVIFPGKQVPPSADSLVDHFFDRAGATEEYEILEVPLLQ